MPEGCLEDVEKRTRTKMTLNIDKVVKITNFLRKRCIERRETPVLTK